MANIRTSVERARGCGYRKGGGVYLRLDVEGSSCGKLPIPLTVCPTCNCGIKFTRGFQWVDLSRLSANKTCDTPTRCEGCPLAATNINKAGLIWIGQSFYKTPEDWLNEAREMGISRRLSTVPHGFELGKTWVAAAHLKAIANPVEPGKDPTFIPGIFHVFRPSRIEYVVKGDETPEQLEKLEKRGFELVRVVRDIDQQELTLSETSTTINGQAPVS
jgi:hypothetical protein